MKLLSKDIKALKELGIAEGEVLQQAGNLKHGFAPAKLLRAATPGDGIVQLSEEKEDELLHAFNDYAGSLDLLKFVPASGAATRMFKVLYDDSPHNATARKEVLDNLHRFAFHDQLIQCVRNAGFETDTLKSEAPQKLFDFMLKDVGLQFGRLPKGLIPFHHYPEGPRTAFEEHLYEGASHCVGRDKNVRIHFTIQPEWKEEISDLLLARIRKMEGFDVKQFHIEYSEQSPATDTVALDESGNLLRDADGELIFRPGGHGALIHNLNTLDADLIFVKNIDNVVSDQHKYLGLLHKKVMGALAIQLRNQLFKFCKAIDLQRVPASLRTEMRVFLEQWLKISTPEKLRIRGNKKEFLLWAFDHFNRPLRICGMVPNEGEPGGGPFWVQSTDGVERLQIVEKAQIDVTLPDQSEILAKSTHFNPVDLVCSTRNYKGVKFDLMRFTDPAAGFVSEKSFEGKKIKALEHPGLWNGAMAHWNTIFVEVPIATFSPVKTVNDLLRPLHQ